MTNWTYCTYFDSGYLSRGLTLIESLRASGDDATVIVLALDEATQRYFDEAALPGVQAIALTELEAFEPRLLAVKPERSRAEYIFTCTPHVMRLVADRFAGAGDVVAYLDADLWFLRSGRELVAALGDDAVGIIPHRYQPRLARKLAKYGTYNVGWLGMRNDDRGRAVLDWYSAATLEWCSDTPDNGRYADQGYLDQFDRFPGVCVLDSPGFNLAPWNTARHRIDVGPGGTPLADGEPVVFFHFHGLKKWRGRYVSAQLLYRTGMGAALKRGLYEPYVAALEANERRIAAAGVARREGARRGVGVRGRVFQLAKFLQNLASLVLGATVPVRVDARGH